MELQQLKYLTNHDKYLKNIKTEVITDNTLPNLFKLNTIYFVLTDLRKKTLGGQTLMLGHWILIDLIQLKQLSFPEIVYFDPTGRGFDHNKKIEKVLIVTQMKYDGKIFVNKRNYQDHAVCP